MEEYNAEAELSVTASSIRITDVTQDGDTLTFAIASQKSNSSVGVCVFRTYEDFDWLQQNLFSQENIPGLQGIIFPPLPSKALPSQSNTQAKSVKQLGFLALGQGWQSYCKALEFYLQQVATHPILSKCKPLDIFLINSESPGKQRGRKGIFNRLSQAVEEMRKESHKDVDTFFQNERYKNTNLAAFSKIATEKLLDIVMTEQIGLVKAPHKCQCGALLRLLSIHMIPHVHPSFPKISCRRPLNPLELSDFEELALACGHFSTSLHLCVNQDDEAAVAFSKICLKLSDIMEVVKRNFEMVASNNLSTLGLGLDLETRYEEAEKEMLFRRTCKLIELEAAKRNTEKAKANKREVMEEIQKSTEKEFTLISSMAKQEIKRFHSSRANEIRNFLVDWCEKQLATAKEFAGLYSQYLETCRNLYSQ